MSAREIEGLARINCTIVEAAAYFGVCKDTMIERLKLPDFRDLWEQGRSRGRISLRRLQWAYAEAMTAPGANMVIHLSKHFLGETEKSLLEIGGRDGGAIAIDVKMLEGLTAEELETLERIARKLGGAIPITRNVPAAS